MFLTNREDGTHYTRLGFTEPYQTMHFFIRQTLGMDRVPDAVQELCPGVFGLAQSQVRLECEVGDRLLKEGAAG